MKNTASNFSYFLPRHIFNSIETMELYPPQTRPSDPELSIDKAMTMLNIAEDQIMKFQQAEPFNPTDFGFEERPLEGDNEFDASVVYLNSKSTFNIYPTKKAMTWSIEKLNKLEDEETHARLVVPDFFVTAFIPNKITGAIILQSLGVIELVNPEGVYVIPEPAEAEKQEAPPSLLDMSKPVLVMAPQSFQDPKDQDKFLIDSGLINEEGHQLRRGMFFVAEALNAMRQVRFLIQERDTNGEQFEGVLEAIDAHPNFTPEQKDKMKGEWNEVSMLVKDPSTAGSDQNEAAEAPVVETAPTE